MINFKVIDKVPSIFEEVRICFMLQQREELYIPIPLVEIDH